MGATDLRLFGITAGEGAEIILSSEPSKANRPSLEEGCKECNVCDVYESFFRA